jgi:hypothetical protein
MDPRTVNAREYVRRLEWNVYEDFARIRDSGIKAPEFYTKIDM